MISGGASYFVEVGPGNVLQGLIKKVNREASTESATLPDLIEDTSSVQVYFH